MDQLAHPRARERRPHQEVAVLADDQAGVPAVVIDVQRSAGHVSDGLPAVRTLRPASLARAAVKPTLSTSGWVNTTAGTARWSAVALCLLHGDGSNRPVAGRR
jgi:hypothetical protein